MATIQKRGNSYRIKVSCGYNADGKQVVQSMTWKPTEGMSSKQIEKELNRQAVMFEESCLKGSVTSAMKFEDFAKQWFEEYAEIKLKQRTVDGYHRMEKRIYKAIGHIRLDKLTVRHIQKFIIDLCNAERVDGRNKNGGKLSTKTIKLYKSMISTICDYAVKMQMMSSNPCKNVTIPKVITPEKEYYSIEEAQHLLELFQKEPKENYMYVCFYTLAIYTGFRLGELMGLEWKDFDFENCLMTVVRTSEWTKERGIYTDTPKTKSSNRILKIPVELVLKLLKYKEWQNQYKTSIGSKWVENDRLFTKWNGEPMGMRSPYKFFEKFCKRTGMRFVNVHSFRHFAATAMILNGVDVKTVQTCLGHNDANTTLNIYAHSFQEAQARAMNSVAECILKKPKQAIELTENQITDN